MNDQFNLNLKTKHSFWSTVLKNMRTRMAQTSTTITFAICYFVFSYVTHRDGVLSTIITGYRQTCSDSNETNTLDNIPKMNCFNCSCKNGFVECVKKECPLIEGCYLLEDPKHDNCCKKCKGCTKDGVYHESGTEWTDPNMPCKLFTCNAGIITESLIRCYAPCNDPMPPALGHCCPTCPRPKVNDKLITQETHIMLKEDPCVLCYNTSGVLTCVKKACPVLNCPTSNIVHGYEKCCPQCLGPSVHISPPNGTCLLGHTVYEPGKQFTLDECTICSCNNSTLHCEKQTCPILQCKKEQQETLSGQCCAQCKKANDETEHEESEDQDKYGYDEHQVEDEDEQYSIENDEDKKHSIKNNKDKKYSVQNFSFSKSCTYNEKTYKNGESWNATACKICTCRQGNIKCTAVLCTTLSCPPNSVLTVPEGQCCPVCIEGQGVCTVFTGSHFRTFDGKPYAFIGSCKYQLVNDCDSGSFNIRLKNTVTGNDVSIKKLSLKFGNTRVELQQNNNTKVNDEIIDLPYRLKSKLEINEVNDDIVITSNLGIKVQWNYIGFIEVAVPNSYRKKLCGLCGNFNSEASDDLTTREGILVNDAAIFAQSWTSGDEVCLENKKYGARGCNPNKDKRLCSYIKGTSVFGKCLKKLNVTTYYEACLEDMCQCEPDDLQCHCESFENYVHDCRRLGILLPRWRKSVGC